jgi:sortase (surface protein transpeptidase)
MDKDGEIDDGFEKKIQLAQMMMAEDRWEMEKRERASKMQMEQEEAQRKAMEQQQLQQMISDSTDMLGQVTIEKDGPLQ